MEAEVEVAAEERVAMVTAAAVAREHLQLMEPMQVRLVVLVTPDPRSGLASGLLVPPFWQLLHLFRGKTKLDHV